jgi:anti-sigma regulatory factor (Ser/Thr protein kinase)
MLRSRRRSLATRPPLLAESTIVIVAVPEQLAAVHEALERFWAMLDRVLPSRLREAVRLQFATAVIEIANNIVQHAYPPGSAPGPLQLRLRCYADRIEARFTDRGVAYALPPSLLSPLESEVGGIMELPEAGMGLLIARAALDRLDYQRDQRGTNRWRLVKWFADPAER